VYRVGAEGGEETFGSLGLTDPSTRERDVEKVEFGTRRFFVQYQCIYFYYENLKAPRKADMAEGSTTRYLYMLKIMTESKVLPGSKTNTEYHW
jgi:hypothetical protein